jgi:hypothetical protein
MTASEISNYGHDTADFLRITVSLATLMKTYAWSSCLIQKTLTSLFGMKAIFWRGCPWKTAAFPDDSGQRRKKLTS